MSDIKQTRSLAAANDVAALLKARNPVIWILTREEARVERYLIEAAKAAEYQPFTWDVAQGTAQCGSDGNGTASDPSEFLNVVRNNARGGGNFRRIVWLARDLPPWLDGPLGLNVQRQLRNLARYLPTVPRDRAQAIIVLTANAEVPPALADHVTVVEWPLPDRDEIAAILDGAIEVLREDRKAAAAPNGTREAAIDAAVGLSGEEATACYARSLVQEGKINPLTVAREKKRVIARERVLEWFDPLPGGLDAVGGLDLLKDWLKGRAAAYTEKARKYGLPAPRGSLLIGVPGCGKSLTAKAIATAWGVPLLRMDLGALKSKWVGESEANLRKAFRVIESVGRCVVWLDEIEKSLAGATQGAADGGVSSDALGAILSWMQERPGQAFVLATCNDISTLPPELLRKGRWDELWFIDLPSKEERVAVLEAALAQHGRKGVIAKTGVDSLLQVAAATEQFTGAELAALVPEALFVAFADDAREITAQDLLAAAQSVVPLAKTSKEKIARLRSDIKGRARPASSDQKPSAPEPVEPVGRQVDF